MPLVLKFELEFKGEPRFTCTVRGYLNNGKAICVVTQHENAGDPPLSSLDVGWAKAVDECTNDTPLQFGKVLQYEDYIWIENRSQKDARGEEFELITFDIVQPDRVRKFSHEISNPKRQAVPQEIVEELLGEDWDSKAEPTTDAFEYWHGPYRTAASRPQRSFSRVVMLGSKPAPRMAKPTTEEVLRDFKITGLVDGWYFRTVEEPPGVYRAEGADLQGAWIFMSGDDPKKLLEECVRAADCRVKGLNNASGLPEFGHFKRRLADILNGKNREDFPLSVLLMDLDRFKLFQDGVGHAEGDRVLCRIGALLKEIGERYRAPIYHHGDEYNAVLTHTDTLEAERFVQEVKEGVKGLQIKFRNPECEQPADHLLSITAGIATTTDMSAALDQLVKTAEAALFQNKQRRT